MKWFTFIIHNNKFTKKIGCISSTIILLKTSASEFINMTLPLYCHVPSIIFYYNLPLSLSNIYIYIYIISVSIQHTFYNIFILHNFKFQLCLYVSPISELPLLNVFIICLSIPLNLLYTDRHYLINIVEEPEDSRFSHFVNKIKTSLRTLHCISTSGIVVRSLTKALNVVYYRRAC